MISNRYFCEGNRYYIDLYSWVSVSMNIYYKKVSRNLQFNAVKPWKKTVFMIWQSIHNCVLKEVLTMMMRRETMLISKQSIRERLHKEVASPFGFVISRIDWNCRKINYFGGLHNGKQNLFKNNMLKLYAFQKYLSQYSRDSSKNCFSISRSRYIPWLQLGNSK